MNTGTTNQSQASDGKRNQIISYYTLRKLIGASGILLPLLVIIGKLISDGSLKIEDSISDYYDNGAAGDILVGVLFALAFFLFSYKGYEPKDNKFANIGCAAALGVALFPTTYCNGCWVNYVHFTSAFVLFTVFIIFSIHLFRKTDKKTKCTSEKLIRNRVYLTCGIIMIICIAGIAACSFWLKELSLKYNLIYWLEAIALISFGFSWMTKSEWLFWRDLNEKEKKA